MSESKAVISTTEFLQKAGELFKTANEKKVTVHISIKRYIKDDQVEGNLEKDATKAPEYDVSKMARNIATKESSDKSYPMVVRIWCGSNAKKTKYSTIVPTLELDQFWQDYSSVVKSGMNGLIKKKKKRKTAASNKDKKKN